MFPRTQALQALSWRIWLAMTCPRCEATAEPALTVQGVSVCAKCGMSVVAEGDSWRLATFADIEPLSAQELLQLRRTAAPIARPGRRR